MTTRPSRFALLFFGTVLLVSGCDSAWGPDMGDGATTTLERGADAPRGPAPTVSVCLRVDAASYRPAEVPRAELARYLAEGAELPRGGTVDAACSIVLQRVECPCFTALELAQPFGESHPQPYLFFDTFNWWGLDYRRTEVRSLVEADDQVLEEVASVYITPVGQGQTALMCYRAGVEPDPYAGIEYHYSTKETVVRRAEVCRQIIYAFAGSLPCEGPACGLPYSSDQLDPNYPAYNLERTQPPLHFDLQQAIDERRPLL